MGESQTGSGIHRPSSRTTAGARLATGTLRRARPTCARSDPSTTRGAIRPTPTYAVGKPAARRIENLTGLPLSSDPTVHWPTIRPHAALFAAAAASAAASAARQSTIANARSPIATTSRQLDNCLIADHPTTGPETSTADAVLDSPIRTARAARAARSAAARTRRA